MNYILVYQAGIANVFKVEWFDTRPECRGDVKLITQGSFFECEAFCRGLKMAGASLHTMACNMAGDITHQKWSTNLDEQPFSDKFHPVVS